MKILITASNGQLGCDVAAHYSKTAELAAYKDVELDITDRNKVFAAVEADKPDVIINCAAITNVDGCESNPELAYKVNRDGAGVVAEAAEKSGAKLIHISTDYVFDGTKQSPYAETDPVNPKSVYGLSKLEGEEAVAKACEKVYILRTAWLYGPSGNNFVKKILKLGRERDEVKIVTDESGNPTSTFELIRMMDAVLRTDKYGIYHATCEGKCSRNEFTREIYRLAGLKTKITDITSKEFTRAASVPECSDLSKRKLLDNCGYRATAWKDALAEYFRYVG